MRVFNKQQCSLSLCSKEASVCCRYSGPSSLGEKKRHGPVLLGRGTRSVPQSRQVSGSWQAFLHTQPPRLRQVLPGAPLFPLCFHGDGLCVLGSSMLTPNKARHCSADLSPNCSEYRFSPAPGKGISKQASRYLSPEDLSRSSPSDIAATLVLSLRDWCRTGAPQTWVWTPWFRHRLLLGDLVCTLWQVDMMSCGQGSECSVNPITGVAQGSPQEAVTVTVTGILFPWKGFAQILAGDAFRCLFPLC